DGALLVLKAIRRLDHCGRRDRRAADGADQLLTQYFAALLGDKPLLRKAGVAERLHKALVVELPSRILEAWNLHDAPRNLGVGDAEAKGPHALVEQHVIDDLPRDLPVEAERARLLERDLTPKLTTVELQLLRIDLAELLDGDLSPSNLGKG